MSRAMIVHWQNEAARLRQKAADHYREGYTSSDCRLRGMSEARLLCARELRLSQRIPVMCADCWGEGIRYYLSDEAPEPCPVCFGDGWIYGEVLP